jgi:endonuclease G
MRRIIAIVLSGACLALGACATPAAHDAATSHPAISPPPAIAAARDGAFSFADCPALSDAARTDLMNEHVFGGSPSGQTPLVRRAYATEYDPATRTPRWTAWHFSQDYRQTPTRRGVWKAFRRDGDVQNPVVDDDFVGMVNTDGELHRGHIAPYFISGGDRDGDGRYAASGPQNLERDDLDDACTVFEINLMTNIAPQLEAFNGSGGAWYELESAIRDLADAGHDIHIIAGTIFGANPQRRGPNNDIAVPDLFYQIVVIDGEAIPFLFVHRRRLGTNGCARTAELETCIASIGAIEQLAHLDFFAGLSAARERSLESTDGSAAWAALWEEIEE